MTDPGIDPQSAPSPGWDWFSEPRPGAAPASGAADDEVDLARAYARVFRGRDGARVLAHLQALTFGRVLGPGASDVLLRHTEGGRHVVALMLALVRRGGGPMPAPIFNTETDGD